MQRSGLAKQYDKLTHRERLQLMVEAKARDDKAEERQLWATCPRKSYTQADMAFEKPFDAIQRIVLAFSIDLAFHLGHLNMLASWALLLPIFGLSAGEEAVLIERRADEPELPPPVEEAAFAVELSDALADLANRTPSVGNESTPAVGNADVAPKTVTSEEPGPPVESDIGSVLEADYAELLPATKVLGDYLGKSLARRYAGRAKGIVVGLGRFTQSVIGLDGMTVLKAWNPDAADDMDRLNTCGVEPDEEYARKIEESAWKAWKKSIT